MERSDLWAIGEKANHFPPYFLICSFLQSLSLRRQAPKSSLVGASATWRDPRLSDPAPRDRQKTLNFLFAALNDRAANCRFAERLPLMQLPQNLDDPRPDAPQVGPRQLSGRLVPPVTVPSCSPRTSTSKVPRGGEGGLSVFGFEGFELGVFGLQRTIRGGRTYRPVGRRPAIIPYSTPHGPLGAPTPSSVANFGALPRSKTSPRDDALSWPSASIDSLGIT
uniref:Uncharacterized protein n=1 Tax=Steinernema glaseri TaxID=37863 RepID=A0A1I7ZZ23_9BILA